jgi:hypothetical protein
VVGRLARLQTHWEKMAITSPSVRLKGKPPTKMCAESAQGRLRGQHAVSSSERVQPRKLGRTLVVVVPAALAVALELELVDLLDLLDNAVAGRRYRQRPGVIDQRPG